VDTVKELLRQKPSRLEILGQFLGQRVADTSTHGDPRIGFLKFQTSQLFEQGDIRISLAVRKRPLATSSPSCACAAALSQVGCPTPPFRRARTAATPPRRYQAIHRCTDR
jgi:hypothetical protein